MRWHGISEEEIVRCIMEPELGESGTQGKTHSWVRVGEKLLRVTWVDEGETRLIITAVFKGRLPR